MTAKTLMLTCVALAISFLAVELLQVNRFLRNILHTQAFWYYLTVLFLTLGTLLGMTFKEDAQSQTSLLKAIAKGIFAGLLGSVIAISFTALLANNSLRSAISVWKNPLYLMYAVFISLGWLYGALSALAMHLMQLRRYWHLVYMVAVCALVGLLETVPIARWVQH